MTEFNSNIIAQLRPPPDLDASQDAHYFRDCRRDFRVRADGPGWGVAVCRDGRKFRFILRDPGDLVTLNEPTITPHVFAIAERNYMREKTSHNKELEEVSHTD